MEVNKEILRWVLLIGAAPIWLPFLRMLWKDFNDALAEEGGVFGRPPSLVEQERIKAERANAPDVLVSEPWAKPGQRPGFGGGAREDRGERPAAPALEAPDPPRRGFR